MDSSSIRKILNINNDWKTAWGDIPEAQYKNYNEDSWNTINIPHNWDNYHGYHQVSHGNLHGVAWYRKAFKLDKDQIGERVFVEFEGVGSYAKVWINGSFLCEQTSPDIINPHLWSLPNQSR